MGYSHLRSNSLFSLLHSVNFVTLNYPLLDSKNNFLLVQIQADSCNTANDPLSNFSWKKCKLLMTGRFHNGVPCWDSGSKVLWCLCRLLCTECLSWWNTSVGLALSHCSPSLHNWWLSSFKCGLFSTVNDCSALNGFAVWRHRLELNWRDESQSGSVLGQLSPCHHVHRNGPFRSGDKERSSFLLPEHSHLYFALLQWLCAEN